MKLFTYINVNEICKTEMENVYSSKSVYIQFKIGNSKKPWIDLVNRASLQWGRNDAVTAEPAPLQKLNQLQPAIVLQMTKPMTRPHLAV